MDSRWERLKDLFDEAVRRPAGDRAAFLDDACGDDALLRERVASLLAAHEEAPELLEAPTRPPLVGDAPDAVLSNVGDRIGRYTIRRLVATGGMGVVYEAEQDSPRRRVALKVLRSGLTSTSALSRMKHEAEILAHLHHPNVAQVFEAGTIGDPPEERPFFAMEFVDGRPLCRYADEEGLTTRERLELLARVCRGVHHAHQKGVIHRDLKPDNILVDRDGEPKILDFGIARITDADIHTTTLATDIAELAGTVPYMSPEQAAGDPKTLDTRSDVYALGVIAYELLSGRLPYDVRDKMIHEAVRVIREVEPTPLSSVNRVFRGDLDTIVAKALEKEQSRRYPSASELAADIQRYLHDEPIVARRASALYQLRKFARRNRVAVVAGSLLVAAILSGLAGTVYGLVLAEERREEAEAAGTRAEEARADADQRADELEQVARFQQEQLAGIDISLMGLHLREGLLEKARAAEERSGTEPAEIDSRMEQLDQVFAGLDFTGLALESLDENLFQLALEAIDVQFDEKPLIKVRLLQALIHTFTRLDLIERAVAPAEEVIKIRRRILGDEHPSTLQSLTNLGFMLRTLGRNEEALAIYRDGLAIRRRVLGDEHASTVNTMSNMVVLLTSMGRYDEALQYAREALETCRRLFDAEDAATLIAINNMGVALNYLGRYDEALAYFREALAIDRRVLGNEHRETLTAMSNVGKLLEYLGRYDEAMPYFREALGTNRRVFGDNNRSTVISVSNVASLLLRQGRPEEALPYYREAMESARRTFGDEHHQTLIIIHDMGRVLMTIGRYDEAMQYLKEAAELGSRVLGDEHPHEVTMRNSIGVLLARMGRYDEAMPYFMDTLGKRRRDLGDEHPDTLASINAIGDLLKNQGNLAEAEPYLREALEGRRRALGDEHPSTLVSINNMGALLNGQRRYSESEPILRECVETGARVLDDDDWRVAEARSHLGEALTGQKRFGEAEPVLLKAQADLESSLPSGRRAQTLPPAIERIVQLYEAWGKPEKAKEWRAKLAEIETSPAE